MGCSLRSLNNGTCVNSDGGIFCSYIINMEDVADIIFDTVPASGTYGCVTDIVTTGTGQVFQYKYDDDDSAFYNQNGNRQNKKHTVTQQAFYKFAGVDKDKVGFANGVKGCCELLAIHCSNSGAIYVQGVDFDMDTNEWKVTKQSVKATVNILTDTGANEDRVEINLNSLGRCFSPLTTMTEADIQAIDNT